MNMSVCTAVATALCEKLGDDWTASAHDEHHAVVTRNIDKLTFDLFENNNRLRTSARCAVGFDLDGYLHPFGTQPPPQITSNVKRGVAVLVADICRRLLPVAEPWYNDACAKAALAASMHQRQQENMERLLAFPDAIRIENRIYGIDWSAEVTPTVINLHLYQVSMETALRLLDFLYSDSDATDPEASRVPTR